MLPLSLPRMIGTGLSDLRAPRRHGEFLIHPPLDAVRTLLEQSRERLGGSLLGRPLADLRRQARNETLATAREYLTASGEPVPNCLSGPWFVGGHQPELFHPGVWFKNFVLQRLARQHGGVPLNLVVDNDVAKAASLRVPAERRVVSVPFDTAMDVPFEERRVHDETLFRSLPERLAPLTKDWPFRPWVNEVWSAMPAEPLLGERIVRARRTLERSMGCSPLETPLSAVCKTTAFAWFACAVLGELPRFVADYNAAIHAYREKHDLKSANHPAPDLARRGEIVESPFWVWRSSEPRRQRLFAARDAAGVTLLAGTTPLTRLDGTPEQWAAAWPSLERQGLKVRTRALTTTLFTRLLLADLFVHGIGGGKYDEVTDDIARRFFDIEPPPYLVATATLLLPFARDRETPSSRAIARHERDLWYNPQRHIVEPRSPECVAAIARKAAALAMPETSHEERVARFRHLLDATAALRPFVSTALERARSMRREVEERERQDAIEASRDYAFCLYPEEMLRRFLTPS